MIQALLLKLAALSLLLLLGQTPNLPEDFRLQAQTVADQAIAAADAQLSSATQPETLTASSTPITPPAPVINNEPITMAPQPAPAPAPTLEPPAPKSQARIEIVNPIPGKGLGREYVAAPEVKDESNYIEIGAVVFGDDGQPVKDADVVVTVNGQKPVTLRGTGDVFPYYVSGEKRVYPVYSFHYEFRDKGKTIIAFATGGMRESATLDVK